MFSLPCTSEVERKQPTYYIILLLFRKIYESNLNYFLTNYLLIYKLVFSLSSSISQVILLSSIVDRLKYFIQAAIRAMCHLNW